ncbi:MAG: hypothetical protein OEO79_18710 [Gemmatimonadota bacterium]|nr:hypothetical protein [Gemmatimonadota bacterium]
MIHSDFGFGNLRRLPVRGSRRVAVLFQTQRPTYFSLSSIRLTVAGDQPFAERKRPGTPSSLSVRTIRAAASPSAYAVNTRSTTPASRGSISMR